MRLLKLLSYVVLCAGGFIVVDCILEGRDARAREEDDAD